MYCCPRRPAGKHSCAAGAIPSGFCPTDASQCVTTASSGASQGPAALQVLSNAHVVKCQCECRSSNEREASHRGGRDGGAGMAGKRYSRRLQVRAAPAGGHSHKGRAPIAAMLPPPRLSVGHRLERCCPHLAEVYRGVLVIVHLTNHGSVEWGDSCWGTGEQGSLELA